MNEVGCITVITGPMFSEKSGELIDRIMKLETYGGKKVKVYKPTNDTRDVMSEVVSRMGYRYPATAISVSLLDEVVSGILIETEDVDVIGFDEVQFFGKPIMALVEELASRGKHVIVDGLNLDYRGKEFGYIGGLLAMADEIVKLSAFCSVCKSPHAAFTQRLVNGNPAKLGAIVVIDNRENYESRCRQCYVPPHKVG